MLAYALSPTRDHQFEAGSKTAGGKRLPLDGLERARALKDLQVIIGDIELDSSSGYAAFVPTESFPESSFCSKSIAIGNNATMY